MAYSLDKGIKNVFERFGGFDLAKPWPKFSWICFCQFLGASQVHPGSWLEISLKPRIGGRRAGPFFFPARTFPARNVFFSQPQHFPAWEGGVPRNSLNQGNPQNQERRLATGTSGWAFAMFCIPTAATKAPAGFCLQRLNNRWASWL